MDTQEDRASEETLLSRTALVCMAVIGLLFAIVAPLVAILVG